MNDDQQHPAVTLLQNAQTPLRTSQFLAHKINRMALHRLVEKGVIERVGAGLFRLPDFTSQYADWAAFSLRYPDAVICTQSAARFHGTTQDLVGQIHVMRPHAAIGNNSVATNFPTTPRVIRLRDQGRHDPFSYGIEEHMIDNIPVKITNVERTLVDMFRFSTYNPSLKDDQAHVSDESFLVCLERTLSRRDFSIDRLSEYQKKAGVKNAMSPFIQTSMHIVSSLPEEYFSATA